MNRYVKNRSVVTYFLLISLTVSVSAQSIAEWYTSMGNFKVTLREDLVPITVNNFIDLTHANFYDGLIFHRVISGFMNQDGCPLGTGNGGPGYTFEDEFHPDLRHDSPGVLSMANSGPNTNGSQYFITVAPTAWLDDLHSVFGKVFEGMDVVYAISEVATDVNDKPLVDVVIDSIRIKDLYFTTELEDFEMEEITYSVDLDDYFTSHGSFPVSYTVISSNYSVIDCNINDSVLSLEALTSNIVSEISVTGITNGNDSISVTFETAHFSYEPIAGFGKGVEFDTGYLDCGNDESLNNFETITFAGFINFSDFSTSQGIISKSSSTSNGWYLSYNESNSKLKFYVKSLSNANRKVYSAMVFDEIDRYYFVICTYDGYDCKIYIDGELDNVNSYLTFSGVNNNETENLLIGRVVNNNFHGSLNNISLWDRALSLDEIKNLNSRVYRGGEYNLIGTWPIEENAGDIINDYSGNENDGHFVDMPLFSFRNESDIRPRYFVDTNEELESVLTAFNYEGNTSFIIVDDVTEGTLSLLYPIQGEFIYTPNPQFNGIDSFSYQLYDTIENTYSDTIIAEICVGDYVDIYDDNYQLSIVNYQLEQNYPNPFNPVTKINYRLPVETMHASSLQSAAIVVYNAMGQQVWSQILSTDHSSQMTGYCLFDGSEFNSGVYYYSLIVDGEKMDIKAMLLIK